MKLVKEIPINEIYIGMRVKSFANKTIGTIYKIDPKDDNCLWIIWDSANRKDFPSACYHHDCDLEIVEI